MQFTETFLSFLENKGLEINKEYIKRRLESHPEFPSLLAVSETLSELGIAHQAFITDKNNPIGLSYPFLAHTIENGDESFEIIDTNAKLKHSFIKKWDGIVVTIDEKSKITHLEHTEIIAKKKNEIKLIWALVVACLFLPIFILWSNGNAYDIIYELSTLIGLISCLLINQIHFGKTSTLAKKLCNISAKDSCGKVIKSSQIKMPFNVTLDDLGLAYFSGTFVYYNIYLLSESNTSIMSIIGYLSLASTILTFVSLAYQYFVLKIWCKLCLIVIGSLWIQIAAFIPNFNFTFSKVNILDILILLAITIPILAFSVYHKILQNKIIVLEKKSLQLLRQKRNPAIFSALLKQQQKINNDIWEQDIIHGNINASIRIIIVSNPYCYPCAGAHEELEKILLNHCENICIITRFAILPEQSTSDKTNKTIAAILEAYHNKENANEKDPLSEWFRLMDLKAFENQFKFYNNDWSSMINHYKKWFAQINVKGTPTIFLQGYELPQHYSIFDLQELIPQLVENNLLESVVANTED